MVPANAEHHTEDAFPQRIVCLTEETTETLYLLEEDWRIVGISGFTVRPERARKEKPIVSAFTKARIQEIVDLKPDLVLGFSDIQADIAAQLVSAGVEVHIFNHRSVGGILKMIRMLGAMVGCGDRAHKMAANLQRDLQQLQVDSRLGPRPRVYFEEWNDPLITGIGWVSELVQVAGGTDIFDELASEKLAKQRIIADPMEVVRRQPDIILASWCGKPFRHDDLVTRPNWDSIPAVQTGHVFDIDSSLILQPGPAALTDGVRRIREIIEDWQGHVPRRENTGDST